MKIKVYDAMMGSGKTTKLIEDIAALPADANVIYITPLLSECHRVAGTSYDEEDEYKRPIVSYQDTEDGIEEYVYDPKHISCVIGDFDIRVCLKVVRWKHYYSK